MKRLLTLAALLFTFSISTLAQNYGLGNAPLRLFNDFRVPETKVFTYALGGNLSLNSTVLDYHSTYNPHTENSKFTSSLSPYLLFTNESDDNILKVTAHFTGAYNRESNESSLQQKNTSDSKSLNLSSTFDLKNYSNPETDFFYNLNAEVNVYMFERGIKSQETHYSYHIKDNSKYQSYNLSAGLGWGKIRNVTPVISSIRFQERMKQLNIITNDLDIPIIDGLAKQFARYGYYSSAHERSQKYFWSDLFSELKNSGINTDSLNVYATNYLQEVPGELRFLRYEGSYFGFEFLIRYTNSYVFSNSFSDLYYSLSHTSKTDQTDLALGIFYSFSHQLSLKSQLGFDISLNGGPINSNSTPVKQIVNAALNLKYDFELTDRLVASLNNQLSYTLYNMSLIRNGLNNILTTTATYFIEDNISMNLEYQFFYSDANVKDFGIISKNNVHGLVLGFNYFFDRGILF